MSLVGKVAIGADGMLLPAPVTVEALEEYLRLAPNGRYAEPAKMMLITLKSRTVR